MAKRPNPTFLKKAEGIHEFRRKRTLIIIACISVVALVTAFIMSVASMQRKYSEAYPELVGAATSTTTEWEKYSRPVHSTTTETATETTTEAETTVISAVIAETTPPPESTEPTETTVQDNKPDPFSEPQGIHFRDEYPTRTVSYQERAVLLDSLKEKITKYAADNPGTRICFVIKSLDTGEQLGYGQLDPVVPSGAWSLPAGIVLCDKVDGNLANFSSVYTYDGTKTSNISYITSTYSPGKQFYLRTLLRYAVTLNDDVALSMVINVLGGSEAVSDEINAISSYISYEDEVLYTDYRGYEIKGNRRTTCYDMANYLEYLYEGYINDPDCYQRLINDMATSEMESPIKNAFGDSADVYHVSGSNSELGAYMDCAIIDGDEPVILVVYAEAKNSGKADEALYTMSSYAYDFISACYAE
ncbi:MAG: serine hydrolase [Clostridiales bacterium]|nr:serine hydrolase [Clostridiales bacterium]